MDRLELTLTGLEQALDSPPTFHASWCHIVRKRLRKAAEALAAERTSYDDPATGSGGPGWLSARAGHLVRERDALTERMTAALQSLAARDDGCDVAVVRDSLRRLTRDVRHHQQRVHDLAYDHVFLEVGGSE